MRFLTVRTKKELAMIAEKSPMLEKGRVEGMEKIMKLLEQGYSFDEIKKILRDGSGQGREA